MWLFGRAIGYSRSLPIGLGPPKLRVSPSPPGAHLPGSGTYKSFHMKFFENRSGDLRPATGRGDWPGASLGGWEGLSRPPRRPQDSMDPRAGRWSKNIYHNTIYTLYTTALYTTQSFHHTPIRYVYTWEHAFHYSNALTTRRRLLRRVEE